MKTKVRCTGINKIERDIMFFPLISTEYTLEGAGVKVKTTAFQGFEFDKEYELEWTLKEIPAETAK